MRPSPSFLLSPVACALLAIAAPAMAQQSASSTAPATSTPVDASSASSPNGTPVHQPNDKSDVRLAAAVRRAIVKDKSLSMTAHNVKFVAAQGVVTLRGLVKNADEKSRIEADVKAVAGVSSVNNQLDVKN